MSWLIFHNSETLDWKNENKKNPAQLGNLINFIISELLNSGFLFSSFYFKTSELSNSYTLQVF